MSVGSIRILKMNKKFTIEEIVDSIDTDAIQFAAEKRMLAEKKFHFEQEHKMFLRMFNNSENKIK